MVFQTAPQRDGVHIPGTNWLIQFTSTAFASVRIFMSSRVSTSGTGSQQPLRLGKEQGRRRRGRGACHKLERSWSGGASISTGSELRVGRGEGRGGEKLRRHCSPGGSRNLALCERWGQEGEAVRPPPPFSPPEVGSGVDFASRTTVALAGRAGM